MSSRIDVFQEVLNIQIDFVQEIFQIIVDNKLYISEKTIRRLKELEDRSEKLKEKYS